MKSVQTVTLELLEKRDESQPRLVLSVIGDSSSFVPKPWLTPVFQLGLIETAKGANDCLILYKGSEEKISSLVWEAVDDFRVMNNIPNTDHFIRLVGLGYDKGRCQTKYDKCVKEKYITLEETDTDEYKVFHADLLANLAKDYVPFVELGEDQSFSVKLPVLVIVAEGDLQTLDQVKEVLKRHIPVLILQGSGKAADLIAECMKDIQSAEVIARAKAPLLFGIYFKNDDFQRLNENIKEIVKDEHLVNLLNVNEKDETQFSDAVVNAIVRAWAHGRDERVVKSANPRSKEDELIREMLYSASSSKGKLNSIHPVSTVTSKNMDVKGKVKEVMEHYQKSLTPASLPLYFYIAYQFIQEMLVSEEEQKIEKRKSFQILLKQAMIADRVDYVKVLLQEEKVEFDPRDLRNVYQKTANCECSEGDCQHIKSILKSASPSNTDVLYKKEDNLREYQLWVQSGRQLCQKFLHYPRKTYNKENSEAVKDQKKEIYQDLLIWALFTNRQELATLFWLKCENQLLAAIMASCVLKRMAAKAKSGKDQFLYGSINEHSSIFEKRALDLQTKLYEEDAHIAMELMFTEQTVWDITVSPLECAFDNAMLDFIAHSCAQRRLNKIWYKRIGASLGAFWMNGFFCGCRRVGEEKTFLLYKFLYAPLTRFLVHYIIFIAALVCYSAFLLIELSTYNGLESIKIYEWLIYVWLVGDILEEYRGVLPWNNDAIRSKLTKKKDEGKVTSKSIKYRVKRYFYDFWNALDFLSYCVTISAVLVRFLKASNDGNMARRLYSLSLFTMYMRFLHALLMSRKLGPKIIMIKEMLKELFRFIGILFVFMVGVGVLYHANMYPAHVDMWNTDGWTYWRIWKIIYIPYWQIYGELFLDKFEANSTQPCTTIESEWESNGEIERCNQYDWVLIVIAALYMLISNLLLVNLVIALFSYRFEIVQANSEILWRYWRYGVVTDYRTRVPAPLNLVFRPFMFVAKCIRCMRKCCEKEIQNDPELNQRMERLQNISANKCVRKMKDI